MIKKTTVQQKRDILQRRRILAKNKSIVSSARSRKATPKAGAKKKQSNAKQEPKPSTARKKMQFILTSEMFISIQGEAMEPPVDDKGTPVEYLSGEMEAHDSEFNKQLLFRFNQKRKQSVSKIKGRGLRSSVVHDLDTNNNTWLMKTKNFKELSRYSLDDMLICDADTKFLFCMNVDMDEDEYSNLLSDSAMEQGLSNIGGGNCKIFGKVYYCF